MALDLGIRIARFRTEKGLSQEALANELGLHALAAPGLPGKTAPLAAAELMRDVIFTAIREREENDGT